jgi:ATP-dependent RNA helicase RhlE
VISFEDLALVEPIRRALKDEGYATPTPIQAQAIPQLLAGQDLLGIAQTGTGKTAAFALPILQRLAASRGQAGLQRKTARCLVLTPTRELALQIGDSFRAYGRHLGLRSLVIFGGVGQNPQVAGMARGVDAIETVVLDEADRMLDMGFIHDVKKIVALLPKQRQTLLFSATMPSAIARLAAGILRDPVRVEVTPPSTTVELI